MSAVWNYFTKCSDRPFTQCIACKKLVGRNGGCTTNMWKHLERCSEAAAFLPEKFQMKKFISSSSITKSTAASTGLWRYFTISSKNSDMVTCKKCGEDIKRVKGNSSNLWKHRQACAQLLELIENTDEQNFDGSTDEQSLESSIEGMVEEGSHTNGNTELILDQPINNPSEIQTSKQGESPRRNEEKKSRKPRSQVWQYFDMINPQCAACKRCRTKLNRFDGSTSNLWGHAKRCYLLSGKKKEKDSLSTGTSATSSFSCPNEMIIDDDIQNYFGNFDGDGVVVNPPTSSAASFTSNQLGLSVALKCDVPLEEQFTFDKITKKLAGFLIKELPSYDILEGPGFKEFANTLTPKYLMRTTKEMHDNVLSTFKVKTTNKLKKCLRESVSSISLVIDSWTDNLNQTSFIAVYAHFICPKLSPSTPFCITLACRTFPISQLKETYFILDTVNRWLRNDLSEESFEGNCSMDDHENSSLLPYRCISFIKTPISIPLGIFKDYTDAESMRILDCVMTKVDQCFKEAACNCMQGTEPNILKLIDSLLKFLQSDPSALSRLRTIQKGFGSTKFLFLPSDFKKGLQEAINSLQLLLELKNALLILFETSGTSDNFPVLLQSDWSALILTSNYVAEVQEIVNKCLNASISSFLPTFFQLQSMSKDYTDKHSRSDSWIMVRPLVASFELAIGETLTKYCNDEQYLLATFLDPSFKSYLSPTLMERATEELSSMSPNSLLPSLAVLEGFSGGVNQESGLNPVRVKTEPGVNSWLENYAATNFLEESNPVEYWLNQSNVAPKITEQALRYLAVPACNKTCKDTVGKSAAFNSLQNLNTNSEALDSLFFLNLNFSTCAFLQELLN